MSETEVLDIAVMGEPGVGKTSLIQTYTTFVFPTDVSGTPKECEHEEMIDSKNVRLQILDAPIELKKLTDVDGVIICFACDNVESYRAVQKYSNMFDKKIPKVMVGCKADTESRAVGTEEFITKDAYEYGASKYIETAAKNESNVKIAFTKVAALALAYHKRRRNDKEAFRQNTLRMKANTSDVEDRVHRRASIDAMAGAAEAAAEAAAQHNSKASASCSCIIC